MQTLAREMAMEFVMARRDRGVMDGGFISLTYNALLLLRCLILHWDLLMFEYNRFRFHYACYAKVPHLLRIESVSLEDAEKRQLRKAAKRW